jgi:hypothetical protein
VVDEKSWYLKEKSDEQRSPIDDKRVAMEQRRSHVGNRRLNAAEARDIDGVLADRSSNRGAPIFVGYQFGDGDAGIEMSCPEFRTTAEGTCGYLGTSLEARA